MAETPTGLRLAATTDESVTLRWLVAGGLKLNLDAAALNLSNNDPVATWTDQSPAGNHATGYGVTYKTNVLNGLPVIDFDGADDHLVIPGSAQSLEFMNGSSSYSTFAVVRSTSTNLQMIMSASSAFSHTHGSAIFMRGTQLNWVERAGGSVINHESPNNSIPALGTWFQASTRWDYGVQHEHWINNAHVSTQSNVATPPQGDLIYDMSIGLETRNSGFRFGPGQMAQLLIYNRLLSVAERNSVGVYLADKWGL